MLHWAVLVVFDVMIYKGSCDVNDLAPVSIASAKLATTPAPLCVI